MFSNIFNYNLLRRTNISDTSFLKIIITNEYLAKLDIKLNILTNLIFHNFIKNNLP